MAQGYDKYELDNQTGQSFRFALNDILEASATQNSGDNSPNTTNTSYPYQVWVDTTNDIVKIRDAATASSWYSLYSVDSDGKPTGAVSYGSYTIATNDTAGTGGTTAITVDTSQRVGIGNTSPSAKLYVSASTTKTGGDINANADELVVDNSGGNTGITLKCPNTATGRIAFGDPEDNNAGQINYSHSTNSMAFDTGGSTSATIDNSGNICIGTTSIGNISGFAQVAFNGTSGGLVQFLDDNTEVGRILGTTAQLTLRTIDSSGTIRFETDSTERMRVSNDGSVLMGTITTSNAPVDVNSRIFYYSNNNSTSAQLFIDSRKSDAFVSVNQSYADTGNRGAIAFYRSEYYKGQISISSTQVYYNTTSDYRLKENIVDVTGGIDLVKQLQPRSFNFINEPSETIMGFVAHEVETVVPNAVSGTKDGLQIWEEGEELPDGFSVGDNKLDENGDTIPDYQCLDQAKLVPVLTAALKEAIAKIETLEAKVAALESA